MSFKEVDNLKVKMIEAERVFNEMESEYEEAKAEHDRIRKIIDTKLLEAKKRLQVAEDIAIEAEKAYKAFCLDCDGTGTTDYQFVDYHDLTPNVCYESKTCDACDGAGVHQPETF
jgi:hypothetical protein